MTTANTIIDSEKVVTLLMNANWDWEHCGDRIRQADMDEYTLEVDNQISAPAIIEALASRESDIIKTFEGECDINVYAALYIADCVAHSLIDCVYPTVTFKAIL